MLHLRAVGGSDDERVWCRLRPAAASSSPTAPSTHECLVLYEEVEEGNQGRGRARTRRFARKLPSHQQAFLSFHLSCSPFSARRLPRDMYMSVPVAPAGHIQDWDTSDEELCASTQTTRLSLSTQSSAFHATSEPSTLPLSPLSDSPCKGQGHSKCSLPQTLMQWISGHKQRMHDQ